MTRFVSLLTCTIAMLGTTAVSAAALSIHTPDGKTGVTLDLGPKTQVKVETGGALPSAGVEVGPDRTSVTLGDSPGSNESSPPASSPSSPPASQQPAPSTGSDPSSSAPSTQAPSGSDDPGGSSSQLGPSQETERSGSNSDGGTGRQGDRSSRSDGPGPGGNVVAAPLRRQSTTAADEQKPASKPLPDRILAAIPPEYREVVLVMALACLCFAAIAGRERRRSKKAAHQALIDPLTGLANRSAFEQRLDAEYRRALRHERPLGLLMIDLDDFKAINDRLGHLKGDRVLRDAADVIGHRVRESDLAARIGGDEFMILCPETRIGGLRALAGSLEHSLADYGAKASIGAAELDPGELLPAALVERADAAMYARKNSRVSEHLAA